jgi:hypothetical protein
MIIKRSEMSEWVAIRENRKKEPQWGDRPTPYWKSRKIKTADMDKDLRR